LHKIKQGFISFSKSSIHFIMKHSILTALFSAFATFALAQDITLDPTPSVYVDGAPSDAIITAEAFVSNTTTAPIDVTWVRENITMPTGWKTSICDLNLCWSSSTNTQSFLIDPTPLHAAGESMHVQFKPFNVAGDGHIDVALYRTGTTTLLARTTYYCSARIVGTARIEQTAATIAPNPATHYINISNNDNIASATISNTLGGVVRTFAVVGATAQLDISDLSTGVYFLQLKNKDNNLLQTIKVLKN
jgi:Secretion system C-terminal sorting domain